MSHFYGTLQGARGQSTRCGHKSTGLTTVAASWKGAIQVFLGHNEETGEDTYEVREIPWQGAGVSRVIAFGVIGKGENNDSD